MNEELDNYLNDQLSENDRLLFEKMLSESESARKDLAEQKVILDLMKSIETPEPSAQVAANFHSMLQAFKKEEKPTLVQKLKMQFSSIGLFNYRPRLAYSIVLLMLGLATGIVLNKYFFSKSSTTEIAVLSAEVKEMKEVMMLSLLQNPSASERIRAVSLSEEIPNVDSKVIDALLVTLNNDSNDNVRIMTLEALATMAHLPKVRSGLVASITQQESPLVQVAMADVMVMLQEKNSVNHFKKLLRKKDLNEGVKMKIEQSLLEII